MLKARHSILPVRKASTIASTPVRNALGSFSARCCGQVAPDADPVLFTGLADGVGGPRRDIVAHEDADLVHALPLAVELQESANLEVAGRDVDGLRQLTPVVEYWATFQSASLLSTMNKVLPDLLVFVGMARPPV